jgi:aldehyde dehydrogenase (NAD+)
MLNDARVPLISFTGSTEVGRRVAQTVSHRMGRTILELGGNNGIMVMDDANFDLALRAVLFGAVAPPDSAARPRAASSCRKASPAA